MVNLNHAKFNFDEKLVEEKYRDKAVVVVKAINRAIIDNNVELYYVSGGKNTYDIVAFKDRDFYKGIPIQFLYGEYTQGKFLNSDEIKIFLARNTGCSFISKHIYNFKKQEVMGRKVANEFFNEETNNQITLAFKDNGFLNLNDNESIVYEDGILWHENKSDYFVPKTIITDIELIHKYIDDNKII